MFGVRLVERIDIEVVEPDAVINDGERANGRDLVWKKGMFPLDDNAILPVLCLRLASRIA
jgi:hypothetical protein